MFKESEKPSTDSGWTFKRRITSLNSVWSEGERLNKGRWSHEYSTNEMDSLTNNCDCEGNRKLSHKVSSTSFNDPSRKSHKHPNETEETYVLKVRIVQFIGC